MSKVSKGCHLLSLLLCCVVANNAASLYGLLEPIQLFSIDPSDGTLDPIGIPLRGEVLTERVSAADKERRIFYFISLNGTSATYHLFGLSLESGAVVFQYELPFILQKLWTPPQFLGVDPHSGDVIAIGMTEFDVYPIVRINVTSKSHQILGNITKLPKTDGFSVYDGTTDIFWVSVPVPDTTYSLLGIDGHSGKVVKTLEVTVKAKALNWDPVTGLMYGIGAKVVNNTADWEFISLDGRSGRFSELGPIKGYDVMLANTALDAAGRTLYAMFADNSMVVFLLSINIENGEITHATKMPRETTKWPRSFVFA